MRVREKLEIFPPVQPVRKKTLVFDLGEKERKVQAQRRFAMLATEAISE